MKNPFLQWIVPARVWQGEWTEPAPTDFEYRMMMLRESMRRLNQSIYTQFVIPMYQVMDAFFQQMQGK